MNRIIARFSAVIALTAMTAFGAVSTASAATGPYSWTDISDKIAERQNRPVWAMAYAAPYWYFTDGQELWSGGHVWKTDSAFLTDLTSDVRNAGISRVDDIVSDGQSVVFLQNVAQRNNSIQVVAYNGTFTNLTSNVRQNLSSNEGVVQISGSNGTWGIVTTYGRVLLYTPSSNNLRTVQLQNASGYSQYIPYIQNHSSVGDTSDHLVFSIQPYSNGWLALNASGYSSSYAQLSRIDTNGNLTSAGTLSTSVDAFASNGQTVLIGQANGSGANIYDGTLRTISAPGLSWKNALVRGNGTSWMIVQGKNVTRFDGTNFQTLDQTRDLFLTAAGNGNGTLLMGGAVSDFSLGNNPSSPLTAKLVKVVEDGGNGGSTSNPTGTYGGGKTYSSTGGPNLTTSGNPSVGRIGNGDTFTYRATASDNDGIDRINLYVNGAMIKTCYDTTCEFGAQYFTNGLTTRAVPFQAKAYDRNGYSTQSDVENLTVDQSFVPYPTPNVSYLTWFEPNQTSIRRDQTVTFNVNAYNASGLKKIEIVANGSTRRTCDLGRAYGNQSCNVTIYGGDYALGTTVSVNAKVTDGNDNVAWTDLKNLSVTDVNGSTNPNTNSNAYTSVWSTPNVTTLYRGTNNQSTSAGATFDVTANDPDGVNRIEMYVNGSIMNSCAGGNGQGNHQCSAHVNPDNYTAGTSVYVNAKVIDTNGNITWSNPWTYSIVQYNGTTPSNPNTNGNSSTWVWSDPDKTDVMANETVRFNVGANDADGIRRIDIFVNGTVNRTCDLGYVQSGNYTCSYVVYGSNYAAGTVFYVNARITDGSGNLTWSDAKTFTIKAAGSATPTPTPNANGTTWTWSDPEGTDIATNASRVFRVGANDADGIRKIEIYVNGTIIRTCDLGYVQSGNANCYQTIYGSNYTAGSSVYVNARITDGNWNIAWSDSKTYTIKSAGSTTPTPIPNTNGASWVWSDPNVTDLTSGQSVRFNVGAYDPDGIRRIDLYINGSLARTCDLGYVSSGNRACSAVIRASDYAAGSSVFVNARITDGNWNVAWSDSKSYNIPQAVPSSSWPIDLPGTLSVTSNHDSGFTANDTITYTATSNDADGIDRIELLVNGELVKTCTNVSTCSYTGGPYNDRTTVSYGAKVVDKKGFALWTGYKTINKQ